ncbi:MAG: hypothetical protein MSG78_04070 [Clostridiales bacterium]|nr:hypothetical protein [Clostridiales bacterium]
MEKVLYMVIQKDGDKTIKWGVSDSIERFIPMCKYLLKNIIGSKDFTVVWTNDVKTKERNFAEFCDIQEITVED